VNGICPASPKRQKLLAKFRVVEAGAEPAMAGQTGGIHRQNKENSSMKCLYAVLILSAALAMSSPLRAQPTTPSLAACEAARYVPVGEAPNLQGQWDFLMQAGERPSSGILALGPMDGAYAGSLTPYATNTVAVRRLTLDGGTVSMSVASREGEVLFEGHLTGNPDTMCGTVLYHGGQRFQMVAVRRPTS
jgi:hypothetical protein